jgi:N-acyl homoserine lactone hydrolase
VIRIHILRCGSVGVDEAVPNRGVSKNALAYTGLFRTRRHHITLPVKAFYIEHPKGRILVDTAWDSAVREHPIRTLTFPDVVCLKADSAARRSGGRAVGGAGDKT